MGLSSGAMSGFRLAPGPIPENYRFFEILPGDTALLNGQEIGGAPDRTASNNSATDVAQPPIRLKRALEEFEGLSIASTIMTLNRHF